MKPPIPTPKETQSQYAIRFHESMMDTMPSTEGRNGECLKYWRNHRYQTESMCKKALGRFPSNEFKHVHDVPVFAEHTTTRETDDGPQTVVYDRSALVSIADRCNGRILDTGDFSTLSEGHTPTREARTAGSKMPDVLGYSGNYRLGMIGDDSPRWAIFTDEYWHNDDVDKLSKLRRRSPEVWLEEKMEDRFMDPIAALGTETPRLDMGHVRYGRSSDGREVEKYTAVAPAAANVFAPDFGDDDKHKYEAGDSLMISPEDVEQIVAAIMDTAVMKWAQDQMTQSTPEPTMEPPADPMQTPEPPAAPTPGQGEDEYMKKYMSDEDLEELDDDDKEAYDAMSDDDKCSYAAGYRSHGKRREKNYFSKDADGAAREEIRKLKAENAVFAQQNNSLQDRVGVIEADKQVAQRYSKLQERQGEGYVLDLDKEAERTKAFTNEQFENHLDVITENYTRIPLADRTPPLVSPRLPVPAGAPGSTESEQYSKEATTLCLREREKGNEMSFEEALESVRNKNGSVA